MEMHNTVPDCIMHGDPSIITVTFSGLGVLKEMDIWRESIEVAHITSWMVDIHFWLFLPCPTLSGDLWAALEQQA